MIDLDTGEVFEDGIPVWVKAKVRWHEDFFMGFQEAFIQVAEDKDMTHQMTRVWLILLGKISFENWVTVPQIEVAERLKMKTSDVSRAVKRLIDKGLILRGPKIGRTTAYKLNSHYAWKGRTGNLSKERTGQVKDFFSEVEKRQGAARKFPRTSDQNALFEEEH
jgi:predicted transcriptional regulator